MPKPHFKEYKVDVEPTDRVLDALNKIKWHQDGTLTYRRSCAHGVCGSDAMRINGRNRLACKVLMQDVGHEDHDRAAARLSGDQRPGRRHGAVLRQLPIDQALPDQRRSAQRDASGCQSPEERASYDDTTKCILCARLHDVLPAHSGPTSEFVGPAAIVNAHRFIFDSRDQGAAERLRMLNAPSGVWRCRTVFNCTDACPRGIEVTKAIEEVKRALLLEEVV